VDLSFLEERYILSYLLSIAATVHHAIMLLHGQAFKEEESYIDEAKESRGRP
jgi:hypothetical protein